MRYIAGEMVGHNLGKDCVRTDMKYLPNTDQMLTMSSKFLGAFNVKSYNTNFSDKIQWKCKIYFPCARFIIQLEYNLIGPSEMKLFTPPYLKTKKHSLMREILLCKVTFKVFIGCFFFISRLIKNMYFSI